ncbi:MAG: zeta toxin family protein [Candidatus Gracilibacteria bacterium]|nr:zeta toxin family protein [Candidatus Gracilibacteria bacterium]
MKQPFLLLIDGMTGAGKTTVSGLLSKEIPRLAVIGMDKVKRFISDFERGERDNGIAKDVVFEMTKKYLDYDISVIVEQPFKTYEELERYEEISKKYKIPLYKVQLFTSPEIALNRVLNRQKNLEFKISEDRIKRNIDFFEKKDKGFLVIDTSDISSEEVKSKIVDTIG